MKANDTALTAGYGSGFARAAADRLRSVLNAVARGARNRRDRRILMEMEDRQLRDMGIRREDVLFMGRGIFATRREER
ncbi:MAG: DUF1127 domain-containing protein [Ectothiorhodospiraceae bacterium]|jgi:uncharacterized protein YjiS (DUF1127 family)